MGRLLILYIAISCVSASATENKGNAPQVQKSIAGGKGHEECMKLQPGKRLKYSFKTDAPVNFNIHYHVGKNVFYPVKKDASTEHKDIFKPTVKQDYCLMWQNESKNSVTVSYEFSVE